MTQATTEHEVRRESTVAECAADFDKDDGPFLVSGVAIGEDEVTHGMHGAKYWPAHELRKAASTLRGVPLTKNHNSREVEAVVGQVTRAAYRDGIGVVYEAEVDDPELAQKIDRGRLDVSIHAVHADGGENDDGQMIAEDIEFIDLSLVPIGAADSNEIEMGDSSALASAELSAADLSSELDDSDETLEDELAVIHSPSYSDTDSERDWEGLDLNDFTDQSWDDLSQDRKSEISGHFMVSDTTFPPANFSSLGFEVVFPDGDLSLSGLRAAKSRAPQSDLPDEQVIRVQRMATRLANKEFDAGWTMENNGRSQNADSTESDDEVENAADAAIQDDDAQEDTETEQSTDGSAAADSEETEMSNEETTDPDTEAEAAESEPEQEEAETEAEQPSRAELAERVEELEAENEDLRSEVEEVRMEYASKLADETILEAEELADRFSFDELREKFEDADTELVESEAGSEPVVEAGGAEADTSDDEDELSEEEQLEQKLEAYESRGLGDSKAAQSIRSKLD